MRTEHRDVHVENQLRAFAVALEAQTAEPIRPGSRTVDDAPRDPVVVEPIPMSLRPDRRQWLLPAVAAGVVAIALVAGLVVLSDSTTPSDTPRPTNATQPTTTTPSTTVPSTTTPSTTAAPSTTVVDVATPAQTVVPEALAPQLAAELAVPEPGSTQTAITGDITWTRLEGDETAQIPIVAFAFDGLFFGSRNDFGSERPTSWWTSTDGITWDETGDLPDEPSGVELHAVDDTLWAETLQHWPETGPDSSLYRWDGATFVPVELPAPASTPQGLVIKDMTSTVVAGLDGAWIVVRRESFGIPWDDLFGVQPPSSVVPDNRIWTDRRNPTSTDTFEVYEQQCNFESGGGGCERIGESWRIRPEVVDGGAMRIDLYDAGGELITSVVPPDELAEVGMEAALYELGRYNEVGGRTESFLVRNDGGIIRIAEWPFMPRQAQFAELDGRLYALSGGDGVDRRLWATSNLETWELVPLPRPVASAGRTLGLTSDGSTIILYNQGPTIYTTGDARAWTAVTKQLDEQLGVTSDMAPADFGWMEAGVDEARGGRDEAPVVAVSPDSLTWQLIPVPLPAVIADRDLTWSDANSETQADVDLDWNWDASAHANTIFIVLRRVDQQGQEIWIGRVDTS